MQLRALRGGASELGPSSRTGAGLPPHSIPPLEHTSCTLCTNPPLVLTFRLRPPLAPGQALSYNVSNDVLHLENSAGEWMECGGRSSVVLPLAGTSNH